MAGQVEGVAAIVGLQIGLDRPLPHRAGVGVAVDEEGGGASPVGRIGKLKVVDNNAVIHKFLPKWGLYFII